MTTIYLGAVAFGVTLLVASLVMGGDDADADADADVDADGGDTHGGDHGGDFSLGWAPVTSLRFWVFLLAFGGGAGYVLTRLGSSELLAGVGALGVGWTSGALAVTVIKKLTKHSASSEVEATELVGTTGKLILPVGPDKLGKVRVDVKGRYVDFIAKLVDDEPELPTGAAVLIVAEGERGSLLVTKGEM